MLERFLAVLALEIVKWLSTRGARDSDLDRASLRIAGDRIREWLRANGARPRE
jgi:hypothetical protein